MNVLKGDIKAIIKGGSLITASINELVEIDASLSFDKDIGSNNHDHLYYKWSCRLEKSNQACSSSNHNNNNNDDDDVNDYNFMVVPSDYGHLAKFVIQPPLMEENYIFDVVVYDKEGKFIAESADGNSGFLGVVYNAVKRERIKKRITGDNLLKLRKYKNGRISLVDEVTGLEIYANSFGVQNLNVFGSLFENM